MTYWSLLLKPSQQILQQLKDYYSDCEGNCLYLAVTRPLRLPVLAQLQNHVDDLKRQLDDGKCHQPPDSNAFRRLPFMKEREMKRALGPNGRFLSSVAQQAFSDLRLRRFSSIDGESL